MQHNSWTDATNYLLVEKLVSMSHQESWSDVAEMCDNHATYQTESFKCKALRKFAAYHGKELQNVTIDEVVPVAAGVGGLGEMDVIVRGVNDSMPATPATSSTGTPVVGGGDDGETKPNRRRGKGGGGGDGEKPPRKKTKKELTGLQLAEADAKQMLSNLAWSAQIVEKAAGQADQFPSQWQCPSLSAAIL